MAKLTPDATRTEHGLVINEKIIPWGAVWPKDSGAYKLKEGSVVQAGDVIGYMGRTGYSQTENTNNIEVSHLHFGLQLIFDESQKEGNNEIWIDCYELVKFLELNRSETVKDQETKEYNRVYEMRESGT